MKKTVILGCGNELLRDEGVGVHAARILQAESSLSGADIEVIDGGTSPDICHLVQGADKLVIVDAVRGGCEAGTVYRFTPGQITPETAVATSLHQMGVLENLRVMELVGGSPRETVVIGVEPARVEPGLELSQELQGQMPRIIETVLRELGLSESTSQISKGTRV